MKVKELIDETRRKIMFSDSVDKSAGKSFNMCYILNNSNVIAYSVISKANKKALFSRRDLSLIMVIKYCNKYEFICFFEDGNSLIPVWEENRDMVYPILTNLVVLDKKEYEKFELWRIVEAL